MAHALETRPAPETGRLAVTVMRSGAGYALCPFFGKCDGLLILDEGGLCEFRPNEHRTPERLCTLIIEAAPERLICGYVGAPERARLRAAGIDIRLGSCPCPVDALVAGYCDLPKA